MLLFLLLVASSTAYRRHREHMVLVEKRCSVLCERSIIEVSRTCCILFSGWVPRVRVFFFLVLRCVASSWHHIIVNCADSTSIQKSKSHQRNHKNTIFFIAEGTLLQRLVCFASSRNICNHCFGKEKNYHTSSLSWRAALSTANSPAIIVNHANPFVRWRTTLLSLVYLCDTRHIRVNFSSSGSNKYHSSS